MTINKLKNTIDNNNKLLRLYSVYLNEYSEMITKELVQDIVNDCGVDEKTAFVSLLSAMLGLDTVDNRDDVLFEREYIAPSVTQLSNEKYLSDPYLVNIKIPRARLGSWELTSARYQSYEGLIWNDIQVYKDLKEIPSLAFFSEPFEFPCVTENGREWMAIKPNEIETMRLPIEKAHGNVVTLGLGMGYFTYMVSEKQDVSSVTVIERDENVIELFKAFIHPQFKNKDKIRIINCDAFDYLDTLNALSSVDYLFADIWHDASDGFPLYLRIKKYEERLRNIRFEYWIEEMLLSQLRSMLFSTAYGQLKAGERLTVLGKVIQSEDDLCEMLSSDNLKILASKLRKAEN